jgi:hypothetical protein
MSVWSDLPSNAFTSGLRYADGVSWTYSAGGLLQYGETSPRTGTAETVSGIFDTYGDDLRSAANDEQVPIELLVAAIALVATRTSVEAAATYIEYIDGFVSFATTPERCYAGCTGLRFDFVQAILGSSITTDDYLATPVTAMIAAARHMLTPIADTRFQPPMVASAYNADTMRYDATSRWRMAQETQIDNFVTWFNTAVAAVVADITLADGAPSFREALSTIQPAVEPTPEPATTTFIKTESQAAVDAGMMVRCEHNSALSAIWRVDDAALTELGNVARDAGAGLGLPLGLSTFDYADRGGTARTMSADEVKQIYMAMRDYVAAIVLYDTDVAEALPGQPVFII